MPPLENHERLTRESELAVGKLLRDEYESGRSIKDLAAEHDYSIARVPPVTSVWWIRNFVRKDVPPRCNTASAARQDTAPIARGGALYW